MFRFTFQLKKQSGLNIVRPDDITYLQPEEEHYRFTCFQERKKQAGSLLFHLKLLIHNTIVGFHPDCLVVIAKILAKQG